jgi:hypothetical protein
MKPFHIYIILLIGALAIIAALTFFIEKDKSEKRLTKLASLAFAFVLAGIFSVR